MQEERKPDQSPMQQNGRSYLSKDAIISVNDAVFEDVHVPEWGGWVRVKGLTARERSVLENEHTETVSNGNVVRNKVSPSYRAALCAMCIVNENGNPLFGQADIVSLGSKNGRALERVFDVARKLSGIGADNVEEAAKN